MVSAAMCSRHITDLEYQKLSGMNGRHRVEDSIRMIESRTGARTHVNRIILALGVITIVLFNLIDFLPMIRAIVAWTIVIVIVGSFTTSGLVDWYAEYEKMRLFLTRQKEQEEDKVRPDDNWEEEYADTED